MILAPRFHVLIHNECGSGKPSMLTRLSEAARRTWTDVPVEFETWQFKVGRQLERFRVHQGLRLMAVSVVVHRSAHEIGGNCIEVTAPGGERVLLDVGEPLSAPGEKAAPADLPATLDLGRPATVLVSHAHQDHYGLLPGACRPLGLPTAGLVRRQTDQAHRRNARNADRP